MVVYLVVHGSITSTQKMHHPLEILLRAAICDAHCTSDRKVQLNHIFLWTQFAIGSRLWSKSTLNLFYKHNSQLVASCDAHLIWVKSNNHQKKWTIVYFECVWILYASFFPQYWSEPLFLKPKINFPSKVRNVRLDKIRARASFQEGARVITRNWKISTEKFLEKEDKINLEFVIHIDQHQCLP